MAATTYEYRMPWGETLRIYADLAQASAPIKTEDAEGDWMSTPYQTADARHREDEMLRLVVSYLGAEWYADPSSDLSHEEQIAAIVEACAGEGESEITDERIEEFRDHAAEAGDLEAVAICAKALDGDAEARAEAEGFVRDSEAMRD